MLWSRRYNVSCEQYLMLFGWCYVWRDAGETPDKLRWSSHRKTVWFRGENRSFSHLSWGLFFVWLTESETVLLNLPELQRCMLYQCYDGGYTIRGALLVSVNLTRTGVPWEEGASVASFRSVRHIYVAYSWGFIDVGEPRYCGWNHPWAGGLEIQER